MGNGRCSEQAWGLTRDPSLVLVACRVRGTKFISGCLNHPADRKRTALPYLLAFMSLTSLVSGEKDHFV